MRFFLLVFAFFSTYLQAYDPNYLNYIETEIANFMLSENVQGVTVAVYYNGTITKKTFGVASHATQLAVNEDTIFEIGSITKVFTSAILTSMVADKKISLDTPISRYIAYLRRNPSNLNPITPVQLATHISSLPRDDDVPPDVNCDADKVLEALSTWIPPYPVGSQYLYSNLGYKILMIALQGAGKKTYGQLLDTYIFQPLFLTNTYISVPLEQDSNYAQGYDVNDSPAPRIDPCPIGSGMLKSTIADMTLFLLASLNKSGPIPLRTAIANAQLPYFHVNDTLTSCLEWRRVIDNGIPLINTNGITKGFSSFMGMVEDKEIGIVILANKTGSSVTVLGRKILVYLKQS